MFSNHPQAVHRPSAVAQAQDYILSIPAEQIAQAANNDNLCVRHGLDLFVFAINPSATLTPPQQTFVRAQLDESFSRYFYARDTLGQKLAEFQLDMRLLQIATFVNDAYTSRGFEDGVLSWLVAPISAVTRIFSSSADYGAERVPVVEVLKGWTGPASDSWKEPLVSYDRDPVRFSDQIIVDLIGLVPKRAQVNPEQAHLLRDLLQASIHTFFIEVQEIGFASANARHLDRLRLLAHYSASCTGR